MRTQPEALRLVDELEYVSKYTDSQHWDTLDRVAAELRRLHRYEMAHTEWVKKTKWVQDTAQPNELGMHRADVIKQRFDKLHALKYELLDALKKCSEQLTRLGYSANHADAAIAKATGETE